MPGVEAHIEVYHSLARAPQFLQFGGNGGTSRISPALVEGVGVGTGMKFANACPDACSRFDLRQLGIDEYAGHDPRLGKLRDHLAQARFLRSDVQAPFRGDLVPPLRYEHRHFRLQFARDRDHLIGRRHLEIELDVGELTQAPHVLVLDMPAVFAQMDRDAVRTAQMGFDCGPHWIRLVGAARLAQCGDMVDVDAEFDQDARSMIQISWRSMNTRRDCNACPPR